ncbi:MAG: sigma-54-dependent Fis family transcriptional regulator [Parachlamydiales bacterium]|nr:sigma-54-dependent Fis family transcriptional regulator [Parachlamydiales bacterium]
MRILVADDEMLMRKFVSDVLKRNGHSVETASDGQEAIELCKETTFDLVFTDMKMPQKTGIDLLRFIKKTSPATHVIIMTAFGTVENAVEAMKLGAFNYLIKPFSFETIEIMIHKVEEHSSLIAENAYLHHQLSSHLQDIVIVSPSLQKIFQDIEKIAKSTSSVLITGESGTGKEIVAQTIHYQSNRNKKPFIKVNCAAIASTLLESEFFGHEKGSFTGADAIKKGRLELAHMGTLLLDEITEIPLELQPKLLRAIQEKEFERVGGTRPIHVDLRFIATSNRNILQAIEEEKFRQDLYYRLNVIPIYIPPLRERKEDILSMAHFFVKKFCHENHQPIKNFSPDAEEKLLAYAWPGNVRELANIIERTVVMDVHPTIISDHLLIELSSSSPFGPEEISLREMEKKHILQMLQKHNFNKTKTAKILQISVKTLRNKLKMLSIKNENF